MSISLGIIDKNKEQTVSNTVPLQRASVSSDFTNHRPHIRILAYLQDTRWRHGVKKESDVIPVHFVWAHPHVTPCLWKSSSLLLGTISWLSTLWFWVAPLSLHIERWVGIQICTLERGIPFSSMCRPLRSRIKNTVHSRADMQSELIRYLCIRFNCSLRGTY